MDDSLSAHPENSYENPSLLAAKATIQALLRAGVRHLVICPGSRNAPLVFAAAAAQEQGLLEVHVRLDERSAAFFALGLARDWCVSEDDGEKFYESSHSRPVALAVTSGTAVAELHAGVLEAAHQGVPLIVLTADRPVRMRDSGLNQTTNQVDIFGSAALASFDVDCAKITDYEEYLGFVEEVLCYLLEVPENLGAENQKTIGALNDWELPAAVSASYRAKPIIPATNGPIHFNICFAPPLTPHGEIIYSNLWGSDSRENDSTEITAEKDYPHNLTVPIQSEDFSCIGTLDNCLAIEHRENRPANLPDFSLRTVVIAGDQATRMVVRAAHRAGIPILAEPTSGVPQSWEIAASAWLLPHFANDIEQVIVTGKPTLGRAETVLLSRTDIPIYCCNQNRPRFQLHEGYRQLIPEEFHAAVQAACPNPGSKNQDWLDKWQRASALLVPTLREYLDDISRQFGEYGFFEPLEAVGIIREELAVSNSQEVVLLGASNTIRNFHLSLRKVQPNSEQVPIYLANRGLSGIDGTISTAAGISLGHNLPVRVVLGDLTFLHDLTGLLQGTYERRPDLQIILFNDGGGQIFSTLEYGEKRFRDEFPRFFSTPQEADIPALAAGLGATYIAIKNHEEFRHALRRRPKGIEVVEVNAAVPNFREEREELNELLNKTLEDFQQ